MFRPTSLGRLNVYILNGSFDKLRCRCKTKGATYMSMKFSRFKKLGLGFEMLMKDKDIG